MVTNSIRTFKKWSTSKKNLKKKENKQTNKNIIHYHSVPEDNIRGKSRLEQRSKSEKRITSGVFSTIWKSLTLI